MNGGHGLSLLQQLGEQNAPAYSEPPIPLGQQLSGGGENFPRLTSFGLQMHNSSGGPSEGADSLALQHNPLNQGGNMSGPRVSAAWSMSSRGSVGRNRHSSASTAATATTAASTTTNPLNSLNEKMPFVGNLADIENLINKNPKTISLISSISRRVRKSPSTGKAEKTASISAECGDDNPDQDEAGRTSRPSLAHYKSNKMRGGSASST